MKFQSSLLLVIGLSLLLTSTYAKLLIKSPEKLKSNFHESFGVDYASLSPKDNRRFHKNIFNGDLVLADPIQACSSLSSLDVTLSNTLYSPILIAEYDGCDVDQKVKNAEAAFATMLILVLPADMPITHPKLAIISANAKIEVIVVAHSDGEKLISYLKDNKNDIVQLTYSFDKEKHVHYNPHKAVSQISGKDQEKVVMDLWIVPSAANMNGYTVAKTLRYLVDAFGEQAEFYPRYNLVGCDECQKEQYTKKHNSCLSGGRYCDPEPVKEGTIAGQYGVLESLRQICYRDGTFKPITADSDWFNYVAAFSHQCFKEPVDKQDACRQKLYDQGFVSKQASMNAERCIENSFQKDSLTTPLLDNLSPNDYLEGELQSFFEHKTVLNVNHEPFTGNWSNQTQIVSFVCSYFKADKKPELCKGDLSNLHFTKYETDEPVASGPSRTHSALVAAGIIIGIVALCCLAFWIRRAVARHVSVKKNDENSHSAPLYKEFKDTPTAYSKIDVVL